MRVADAEVVVVELSEFQSRVLGLAETGLAVLILAAVLVVFLLAVSTVRHL